LRAPCDQPPDADRGRLEKLAPAGDVTAAGRFGAVPEVHHDCNRQQHTEQRVPGDQGVAG
jgi:hypothetical protein